MTLAKRIKRMKGKIQKKTPTSRLGHTGNGHDKYPGPSTMDILIILIIRGTQEVAYCQRKLPQDSMRNQNTNKQTKTIPFSLTSHSHQEGHQGYGRQRKTHQKWPRRLENVMWEVRNLASTWIRSCFEQEEMAGETETGHKAVAY